MKFPKLNTQKKPFTYAFFTITLVLIIAAALFITMRAINPPETEDEKEVKEQAAMAQSAANLIKSGDKLTDIPKEDATARQEFMDKAAATFSMNPDNNLTPEQYAMTCINNATAEIFQTARSVEAYRNDNEQVKKDVYAVHVACYEKYAETAYVAPEKPQSHISPHTFQPESGQHHNSP